MRQPWPDARDSVCANRTRAWARCQRYAMVRLEDSEGSVQVLCMNAHYDKNRDLLTPGRSILVVGEVNTEDERPKIFPQEIIPQEDAPRRFTKQVHLRLNTAHVRP